MRQWRKSKLSEDNRSPAKPRSPDERSDIRDWHFGRLVVPASRFAHAGYESIACATTLRMRLGKASLPSSEIFTQRAPCGARARFGKSAE
jgi:hypothetical protein